MWENSSHFLFFLLDHGFESSSPNNTVPTCVLARAEIFWECVILESLLIKLEPQIVNREGGHVLSDCWKPILAQVP